MAISNISNDDCLPLSLYLVIMRGLERLVLSGVLVPKDTESIVKLAVDRCEG